MLINQINPWPWSLKLGYNQAEILEGTPQHPNEMRAQIRLALDTLETVLGAADMGLQNITRLGIFTTNVEDAMQNFDLLGKSFGPVQAAPPMTLLGVTQLAIPGLMFEIEATAMD